MMEAVFYQMAALILRLAIMTQPTFVTTAPAFFLMDAPVQPLVTIILPLFVMMDLVMSLTGAQILQLVTTMQPTFVMMDLARIPAVPTFQHVTTIVWQVVMTGVVNT
jgi:hypothetical protein